MIALTRLYARHGRDFMRCKSPVRDWESVYQMTAPIDKVRGEGNCARATVGGEEACECVVKLTMLLVVSHILTSAARLRTETSYKAGRVRRVSTTSRSRSQLLEQVKGELVQKKFMSLSGETCQAACEPPFASASKHHRLKGWNKWKQFHSGEAGVSRGHSTELPIPTGTGRTEQ